MRGISTINTEQDIINNIAVDKQKTKRQLEILLMSRYSWFKTVELETVESGLIDETHKVTNDIDMLTNISTFWQYELQEDPNSRIYLLGLTPEKVEQYIAECEE